MTQNFLLLISFGIFIFFIFVLFILGIFIFTIDSSSDCNSDCVYIGPIPEPLQNEVIGAASNVKLYSNKSENGYVTPCFVYYTENVNGVTYLKNDYGIKLPVGVYNVYVSYLSYSAVDGDTVTDKLIQTSYIGTNNTVVSQRLVDAKSATFSANKAMTEYDTVELNSNDNILRIESALIGNPLNTLVIDRIEVLFEKVLL